MRAWLTPWLLGVLMVFYAPLGASPAEAATQVEKVTSEGGIEAYLVHEPALPFLSLSLYFRGGAITDPEGREGLAYMVSGLLDEGAGDYDSQGFRTALEDNAIRLRFDAERDGFRGTLKTLSRNRDLAFELLRLALIEPRFDEEPVERIRAQIIAGLRRDQQNPSRVASQAWFEGAYPEHAYGRPTRGTEDSIAALTVEDLRGFVTRRLARDNLIIGVAGDITAEQLGPLLDQTFGALPDSAEPIAVAATEPQGGALTVVDRDVPQSVIIFGHDGVARDDPDYYTAYVVNYILGGGGFSSRLMDEIREKRGLAYSVNSYLYPLDYSALWLGNAGTNNEDAAETVALIRQEVGRVAEGALSEEDLADAKRYLTGSFPLRLTSNDSIASILVGMQLNDLGQDYIETRNSYVEAVTLEDAQRVARALFHPDRLRVTVVGRPVGLEDERAG